MTNIRYLYLQCSLPSMFVVILLYYTAGLEFIYILDKILSVQQEKSGMQMNQSCTININCATAMLALSAQYMS